MADLLNESGLATLLMDLLTEDEQEVDLQTAHLRFDIPFLAKRLVAITQWLLGIRRWRGLKIGHFGASTGAGAALWRQRTSASQCAPWCRAAAGRIWRDGAGARQAPTLLIVGGADPVVLDLNQKAMARCIARKP